MNILRLSLEQARQFRRFLGEARRSIVAPQWPDQADKRMLVHLGPGEISAPGFVNVDVQPMPHIHYVADVRNLAMFPAGTVDLIYACHVLEHVSHRETARTLADWLRVLKPGGILRLSVPDFDRLVDVYLDQGREVSSILPALLGGQQADHNVHRAIFSEVSLRSSLEAAGFGEIRSWDPAKVAEHGFEDWASRPFVVGGKSYAISLNLEAVKSPC